MVKYSKEGLKFFKPGGEALNYPNAETNASSLKNVSRVKKLNVSGGGV
jgi:hypothetical protein